MALADEMSSFVHGLRLDDLPADTVAQAKTLVLDALACMIAGADTDGAGIAMNGVALRGIASHGISAAYPEAAATVAVHGLRVSPADAALVNGAMLRSLDMMDTYVSLDVCHPSEVVPAALAAAESGGSSGGDFLAATIAGLALHQAITDTLALHRHGLHHAGQAAWTVAPVAGRLLKQAPEVSARALTITAHRLLLPESFARGQLTNFKAMAYPLLAREAIEALRLAWAGLTGSATACEDVLALLTHRFGMAIELQTLLPQQSIDLSTIMLKMYPAQYALQPLIAAACNAHGLAGRSIAEIERLIVHASRRTVERTADPAKYAPAGPEAADHSLPFCVAVALMDGALTPAALHSGRWAEPETLALMQRIVALPVDGTSGYQVGRQQMEVHFRDGTTQSLSCNYPPAGETPTSIAERKLRAAAQGKVDAGVILDRVMNLENEADLGRLAAACVASRAKYQRITGGHQKIADARAMPDRDDIEVDPARVDTVVGPSDLS